MCMICGRNSCCINFHSLEEQRIYEPAIEAYEKYLEILAECEEEYTQIDEDMEEDDGD